MKALAVECAFFLLVDLVLVLATQPQQGMHPDSLLRGMIGRPDSFRRAVQRTQSGRLPLYMMQLYRTMLNDDRGRTTAAKVKQATKEDNLGLYDSDSVISLVAKSEY